MSGTQDQLSRLQMANDLTDRGDIQAAMVELRALEGFGPAHANLALLLEQARELAAAIDQHRLACALMPDHPQVWFNAGTALEHARHYTESEAAYRSSLALKPDFPEAWHNLGNCLQEQGRVQEADQAFRQALSLKPDFPEARSSHLMNLHYLHVPESAIFKTTKAYAASFEGCPQRQAQGSRQDGPLRIGLLCAYVRRHPLGALAVAGLERLDKQRFSLFAYVNGSSQDTAAQRLRAACADWRDISALSDQVAAEQIQADGIDILIDLAGHTRGHRLGVLALKPAPKQIHWGAAYWNGLGLSAVDYLLTDKVEAPPDDLPPLVEKPLYLPDSFACFLPPDSLPAVEPRPPGPPCFGSFNRLAKLNDEVLALWGRVMAGAPPGSCLLVQAHAFDDEAVRRSFLTRLQTQGIAPAQVKLIGALTPQDVLKTYGLVDVVLDSFPWSGSIVTLEALVMGVPVVTWPHPSIRGRHSASFLTCLGEQDWIAQSPDDYVAKALGLVLDATRLAEIRSGLRDRMLASKVCDAVRFAQALEAALLAV
jgi:predicted O-linked N-acetylglucosamine transferase (SPINDLY family)